MGSFLVLSGTQLRLQKEQMQLLSLHEIYSTFVCILGTSLRGSTSSHLDCQSLLRYCEVYLRLVMYFVITFNIW